MIIKHRAIPGKKLLEISMRCREVNKEGTVIVVLEELIEEVLGQCRCEGVFWNK
jgi:hypothetical protein